jgi:LacI family transcriptional regulator
MAVTLKDIARHTGFSITTISRALAGYSDVSEATRLYIRDTADKLGYQPNQVARQLQAQRTRTLGMVLPIRDQTVSSDFFSELLRGVSDAASHANYDMLTSAQEYGSEAELHAYRRLVGGGRVDGMILARARRHDPRIAYLKAADCPFAVSGRGGEGEVSDFPYIDVDNQAGIRQATDHLIALGHRSIGLILPPVEMAYTADRHQGYRDGLAAANLTYDADAVTYGDLLPSGGYHAARQLLTAHPELTAIIACSDLMAFGAIQAARLFSRQVGVDLAVTGFDDIPVAQYANPPLTTVQQPIYEIGQQLAEHLIALIEGTAVVPLQVILATTLQVRGSSGRTLENGAWRTARESA